MDSSPPSSSVHGDSPGKNTGVGCHSLFQGIFPTQGLNPHLLCLLHWLMGSLTTSTTQEAQQIGFSALFVTLGSPIRETGKGENPTESMATGLVITKGSWGPIRELVDPWPAAPLRAEELGSLSPISCPSRVGGDSWGVLTCGLPTLWSHRKPQAGPGTVTLHSRPGEPQPPSSPTTSSWYKHSRLFTASNSLLEGGRVHIIFQTRDSCIRVGHLLLLSAGTPRASDSASLRSPGEALLIRILADQKSTERKVLTYADPWGGGLITRSWLPRSPSLPHPQLPAWFPFRAH